MCAASGEREDIPSPCVRNCCLDEAEVCMGCSRTLPEILAWHGACAEEKRAILRRCRERRARTPDRPGAG